MSRFFFSCLQSVLTQSNIKSQGLPETAMRKRYLSNYRDVCMPPPPFFVSARPLADAFRWLWDAAKPQDRRLILSTVDDAAKLSQMLADFDLDKAAYFQEIEEIQQAKKKCEGALRESGAPVYALDAESSYSAEITKQAKRVLAAVNADTVVEFEALGESEVEQISAVEKRLRALLIDALHQTIALNLEQLAQAEMILASNAAVMIHVRDLQAVVAGADQDSDTETVNYDAAQTPSPAHTAVSEPTIAEWTAGEAALPAEAVAPPETVDPLESLPPPLTTQALLLKLQGYLLENKDLLIGGSQLHIHAVTEMIFQHPETNITPIYVAWRCMDSEVETVQWPMLTVAPHSLKANNTCFSTADTYEGGGLILEEASRLIRLQLAKCVLACTDSALPLALRAELSTQVVFYLAEIQRSHNDTIVSQDSPSCYPGTFTRLAQMLRLHPAYKDLFPPPDDRMIIAEAFFAKLSRIFFDRCASLETLDEKSVYFDALAGYLRSEYLPVLSDSYLTFADALALPQWRECRLALRLAIREGETEYNFIRNFLQNLQTLGRIKEISPVSESWLRYLLVSLVDSRETLAKVWYKLEVLFIQKEEPDAALTKSSAPLLPQYEQLPSKRKRSVADEGEPPADEERGIYRRRRSQRSPSPSAESLLEHL